MRGNRAGDRAWTVEKYRRVATFNRFPSAVPTTCCSLALRGLVARGWLAGCRQIPVVQDYLRGGCVRGLIWPQGRREPVHVTVEHAEGRGDEDRVMDLQVGRACLPRERHVLGAHLLAAFLHGSGDPQQGCELRRDRAVSRSARTWSTSVMPSGSWADAHAACEAVQ